jgi:radical SAM protein with 4Fe4S-binding SPASM domain
MKSETPFALQVHVTEKCNLRCKHCYNEEWTREIDIKSFEDVLHQFKKILEMANTEGTVYITGGEPLTWKHHLDAIRLSIKEKIPPRLFTNGTLIDRKKARELKDEGIRYVQVSLDGIGDTHDSIRGKGMFRRAIMGIHHLVREDIEVIIMVTLMKRNLYQVTELLNLAERLGVKRIAFGRFVSMGNGVNLESDNLTRKDIRQVFSLLEMESKEREIEIAMRDPLWGITQESNLRFSGCAAGQLLLDVLTDGTVLPCRRLEVPVGNLFKTPLHAIWLTSPILRKLRNRGNLECRDCSKIQICGGCRGLAYASTGDMFARDPHCFRHDEEVEKPLCLNI